MNKSNNTKIVKDKYIKKVPKINKKAIKKLLLIINKVFTFLIINSKKIFFIQKLKNLVLMIKVDQRVWKTKFMVELIKKNQNINI